MIATCQHCGHQVWPEHMDVPTVATYISVSQRTVRAWVQEQSIPHARLGRALRFSRRAIDEWVESQAVAAS